MIKDLIIRYSPAIIVLLVILFTVVKVSIISVKLNKSYFRLFFSSFVFYNRIAIRNTFHEQLKSFYKKSNKINAIFYTLIILVLAVYYLMKAIK